MSKLWGSLVRCVWNCAVHLWLRWMTMVRYWSRVARWSMMWLWRLALDVGVRMVHLRWGSGIDRWWCMVRLRRWGVTARLHMVRRMMRVSRRPRRAWQCGRRRTMLSRDLADAGKSWLEAKLIEVTAEHHV